MLRLVVFGSIMLALSACASRPESGSSVAGTRPERVRVDGNAGSFELEATRERVEWSRRIQAPRESVWAATAVAYRELGIPVGVSNPAKGVYGNPGFSVRRELGDVLLTKYVDCGRSIAGPNALSYTVTLSVVTRIAADSGNTSLVMTEVTGRARPAGVSATDVPCTSNGELERRLLNAIALRAVG